MHTPAGRVCLTALTLGATLVVSPATVTFAVTSSSVASSGSPLSAAGAPGARPAAVSANTYVALGDSYSAGTGTYDSQNSCYQSPLGYPALLADATGLGFSYQACQGATIGDVRSNQLGPLDGSTRYVTMTVGGNDLGFTPVLKECALPGWISDCDGKINAALATLHESLPGRLDGLYADIRARAGGARVLIADYPRLFNGTDCSPVTFFSPAEMSRLNGIADELDTTIIGRSQAAGLTPVDIRDAFAGHAVCDSSPYVNNVSVIVNESFHPNVAGNRAYAAVLGAYISTPNTALASRRAALAARTIGASPRTSTAERRAAAPRSEAVLSLAATLTTRTNLARARRAGLSATTIVRLAAGLRSSRARVVDAALASLQRLDTRTARRSATHR